MTKRKTNIRNYVYAVNSFDDLYIAITDYNKDREVVY